MRKENTGEAGTGLGLIVFFVAVGAFALGRQASSPPTPDASLPVPTSAVVPSASGSDETARTAGTEHDGPIRLRDLLTGETYATQDPTDARRRVDSHLYEPLSRVDAARIPRPASSARPAEAERDVQRYVDSLRPAQEPSVPAPDRPAPMLAPVHSGTVHVRGYTRRDGTYVQPYTRRAPRR